MDGLKLIWEAFKVVSLLVFLGTVFFIIGSIWSAWASHFGWVSAVVALLSVVGFFVVIFGD